MEYSLEQIKILKTATNVHVKQTGKTYNIPNLTTNVNPAALNTKEMEVLTVSVMELQSSWRNTS